ncbi:conserved exported hypothetical protein [Verrucomicrobia bacterium]|nr:conserved exported hypothetical protein [Verrucomicrobiota bacterium]
MSNSLSINRSNRNALAILALLLVLLTSARAPGAFVYETPAEFVSSGDFNGDGIADVLVLDKATGNARVGYGDGAGNLTWSAPLVTGAASPDGLAVGRFLATNQDAIAITSSQLNRVLLVDLSNATSAPPPLVLTPSGIGPDLLIGLAAPYGAGSNFDWVFVGSGDNNSDTGQALLELFALAADALSSEQDSVAQQAYLARGNSLLLGSDPTTYAAAIERGPSNDQFVALSAPTHFGVLLSQTNLGAGSDYVFGQFNGEPLPRFVFYVPGQSNLTLQSLVQTNGSYVFQAGVFVAVGEAIQTVYYLSRGTDGTALIQFADGVQGMTLSNGVATLAGVYRSGAGSAGNVFTGIVPLGAGDFALLDGPASSAHAQVVHFNGSNYTQRSASILPSATTRTTRANVWLFQSEPFVNSDPGFVASVTDPDWSDVISGLPGALTVLTESDAGSVSGLGSVATNSLGAPPAGAVYAVPDQYRDFISLFSYAAARAPEPVSITISPPAGLYGGPIQVSFSTLNGGDQVFYRTSPLDSWHTFTASFALTNDATIQYYGLSASAARSMLLSAAYSFGAAGGAPQAPLDLAPGTTNPAPTFTTNQLVLSDIGTIFYGRRSTNNQGTIWAINLDGSRETYITTGARPRVSRDGRWLAFLREGDPFNNQGNLWVRDLVLQTETRLLVNTDTIVGYDWDLTNSNLVFDLGCSFWTIGLSGPPAQLPLAATCGQSAPVVNPVDGSLAFQVLPPGTPGIYLAPSNGSAAQPLALNVSGARWPAWDSDGQHLALVDGAADGSVDGGGDLFVFQAADTNLYQITAIFDSVNGFPHGALWSPNDDALVGTGTINGTNGIWVLPLIDECMCSAGPPFLLPTAPGDAIDFVGSIVTAPSLPPEIVQAGLFIRLEPDSVLVYWGSTFANYTLEYATDLSPSATWTAIPGPYAFDGYFYQYSEALANLQQRKFFRLRYTGPM